jgi:hypothetical protein
MLRSSGFSKFLRIAVLAWWFAGMIDEQVWYFGGYESFDTCEQKRRTAKVDSSLLCFFAETDWPALHNLRPVNKFRI